MFQEVVFKALLQKIHGSIFEGDLIIDKEFHYYITNFTLVSAGVPHEEAYKIAYSSQYIDDNVAIIHVNKDQEGEYKNYISQTKNIFLPRRSLRRIYPVFHFIPGNPEKASIRKDDKKHEFVCVPDNKLANDILDRALETENPYRIGIALHGYADTWAHQNYTGTFDEFNRVWKFPNVFLPSVGHAGTFHLPDNITNVWRDSHLKWELINNQQRFLDALKNIYYSVLTDEPLLSWEEVEAFIKKTSCLESVELRYECYQNKTKHLTKETLSSYDAKTWFGQAINEKVNLFRDATYGIGLFPDKYQWKNTKTYRNTDWYKFQEAIKQHQTYVLYLFRKHELGLFDTKNF